MTDQKHGEDYEENMTEKLTDESKNGMDGNAEEATYGGMSEERKKAAGTAARMRKLGHAMTYILWGYVVLHFSINVETWFSSEAGTLDLLPGWLGFLLYLHALRTLEEEEPSAALLSPMAKVLAVLYGILWVTAMFTDSPYLLVLDLIETVLNMYFVFQLFTNLAAIAGRYGYSGQNRLLTLRTVNTVMSAGIYIAGQLTTLLQAEVLLTGIVGGIYFICLLILMAVMIWTGVVLFSLKKYMDKGNPPSNDETVL